MDAVILAGGLGSRLKPFTDIIPKPLLPVGEKSILEIQLLQLKKHGFKRVFLATNYKSEYIENFFGDGSKLGIELIISKEDKPLGTCGPLSIIQEMLTYPVLVMNGDILTNADFSDIYNFALNHHSAFTVVTKEILTPFEFGNVISEGDYIRDVQEKPDLRIEIIAGIYVLKKEAISLVPPNKFYGMDQLIKQMLATDMPIAKYFLRDYWVDIGRMESYKHANESYEQLCNY